MPSTFPKLLFFRRFVLLSIFLLRLWLHSRATCRSNLLLIAFASEILTRQPFATFLSRYCHYYLKPHRTFHGAECFHYEPVFPEILCRLVFQYFLSLPDCLAQAHRKLAPRLCEQIDAKDLVLTCFFLVWEFLDAFWILNTVFVELWHFLQRVLPWPLAYFLQLIGFEFQQRLASAQLRTHLARLRKRKQLGVLDVGSPFRRRIVLNILIVFLAVLVDELLIDIQGDLVGSGNIEFFLITGDIRMRWS